MYRGRRRRRCRPSLVFPLLNAFFRSLSTDTTECVANTVVDDAKVPIVKTVPFRSVARESVRVCNLVPLSIAFGV